MRNQTIKYCKICKNKIIKGHYKDLCINCYSTKYRKTNTYIQYHIKRNKLNEVKERKRQYEKSPQRKAYKKEYSQRKEVKKRVREREKIYRKSKKWKEYIKKYSQTPKYKKYHRQYQRSDKSKKYKKKWYRSKCGVEYYKKYRPKYQKTKKYKQSQIKYNKSSKRKNQRKIYNKEYYKIPLVKFRRLIGQCIWYSFKNHGYAKESHTFAIIGLTYNEFIKWTENQFIDGMTWDNFGINGWSIDHYVPLSYAKTKEEVVMLNNYKNLRPMWLIDNLKKANKLPIDYKKKLKELNWGTKND